MTGRRQVEKLETLARRLCPPKSDGQQEHVLVPSAGRRLTAAEARASALDRVAAVVSRTCEWDDSVNYHVGDYRFLVVDFSPRKDVGLYLQIWTEPGEPVLIEASSGAWNPAARPYVQAPQRAALRKLGYKVGGRARNYQKEWALSRMSDTSALVEELVTILVEVFGYRGQRPLTMAYCSAGRTEAGQFFPALGVDDVKRMLRMANCQVVEAESVGPLSPAVKRRLIHVAQPFPFVVEMRGLASRTPETFEAMRLVTPLPAGRGLPPEHLETLVRECPFGRTFRDEEGDLLFIGDFVVTGTTERWFLTTMSVWVRMRQRAVDMLRLALASSAPRAPGGAGGGDIDDEGDQADGDDEPREGTSARTVVH
jgi:hypothetical protein